MDTRSGTQIQDQERTHTMENESATCFHKYIGEKIELVRRRLRIHTEESVEDGYTTEKEEDARKPRSSK